MSLQAVLFEAFVRENRVRHAMLMARKRLHCWIAIKIQFKFRTRILITATERNYQDCYHSLLRLGIINRPRWGFLIVGKFSFSQTFFFSRGKVLFLCAATNIKAPFFEREERTRKNVAARKMVQTFLFLPFSVRLCNVIT